MTALNREHLFTTTLIGVFCLTVGGCAFKKSKQDAEKVVTRHFQAISTNGYDTAMADYGTQFFVKVSVLNGA